MLDQKNEEHKTHKMKLHNPFLILLAIVAVGMMISCNNNKSSDSSPATNAVTESGAVDQRRLILPYTGADYKGKVDSTYQTSTPDFGPALPLEAPTGAPNIIVIMLDDVGYGQTQPYGGIIETPNIQRLANDGIVYTNFHTTALCSPSRAAFLTGRNHHSVGLAAITEAATGFPGNFGTMPKSAVTIAEVLKQNGYNTMAFGKWHLAPYTAYTASGPFDNWPLGQGFENFYGFLGGETDQFAPLLIQDNRMIETPTTKDYHLSEDLTDKTIAYIKDQQQSNTGKPFFTYLAYGAAHAPLLAPKKYIDKYKGKFDQGWDKVREEIFENQKKLGVIPQNAVLNPRNKMIPAWDELSGDEMKVYARLQEVFAGFLDHADTQIGRLLDALDEMGIRDNTMILLVSDNGASQEGLQHGTANTDRYRNYFPDQVKEMLPLLDKLGSAETDPHYPMGWSQAGNTPFKRWKQDTDAGGNTDPLIISWPGGKFVNPKEYRRQYHHLVDIVPTLLEVTKLPAPTSVNGVKQQDMPGVSMAYTFTNPAAPTTKKVQYFEMLGSRAIWSGGWKALAWHKKDDPYSSDVWELYHVDEDFTESNDLARDNPEKLQELIDLWWNEAKKYNVLPLDDRRYERVADPTRPVASVTKDVYTFYPNASILHPLTFPNLMSQNHTITAYASIPATGAEGVLACSGGEFGGWSLFIKGGKLYYVHNYLKLNEFTAVSSKAISSGIHQFKVHYTMKEKSLKPDFFIGDIDLYIDDQLAGSVKDVKMAAQYSSVTGYGLLVGRNSGTAVSHMYKPPYSFTGKLEKVTIELK